MVMTPYARVGDMLWTVAQSRAPKYLCARDMWRSPCLKLSARVRAPGNEDRACERTLDPGDVVLPSLLACGCPRKSVY